MRNFSVMILFFWLSLSAHASEALLEQFFVEVKTLQANFEQKVVDETGMLLEFSRGRLTLARPGKFRWDYAGTDAGTNPESRGQQIVADGKSIYMYDPELEQVTRRDMRAALGQVPSLVLVQSGIDINEYFEVTDVGLTDGLSWVSLRPIDEDAGYQNLMVGFSGKQLDTIVLLDGLGNETRLSLSRVVNNPVIAADIFNFKVPAGTDVLSQ